MARLLSAISSSDPVFDVTHLIDILKHCDWNLQCKRTPAAVAEDKEPFSLPTQKEIKKDDWNICITAALLRWLLCFELIYMDSCC